METLIRPETPADNLAVGEVLTRAFNRFNEYNFVTALRKTQNYLPQLALAAEAKGVKGAAEFQGAGQARGKVVGYALCTIVHINDNPCLSLAPFAVHPEFQKMGIGFSLLNSLIAQAKQTNFPLIVVLGRPDIFLRVGFSRADTLGITPPFDIDPSLYLAYQLSPSIPEGTVSYPNPFA